jgi:hypothetical protein
MYTKYQKRTSGIPYRLILTTWVCAGFLTMGLNPLPQPIEPATGTTMNVTITSDVLANDGKCSLREAVIAANTNMRSGSKPGECPAGKGDLMDSIVLASGAIYALTRSSTFEDNARNGDLDIRNNPAITDLTIRAGLNGRATIKQHALVDDRVLDVLGAKVIIQGVMFAGGSNVESGGGIRNSGKLTLIACKVRSNSARWMGGGIFNNSKSVLRVVSSTISGNTSSDHGGGLVNGGGIVTLTGSTVSNNTAAWGGGLFTETGRLTLVHTTVSGNSADNDAGGIFVKELSVVNIQNGSRITGNTAAWGGGISSWNSTLTVDASVISNNTVPNSGGGLLIHDGGTAVVQNGSVISNNAATYEGGISNWGGSTLTVDGSVISGNTASGSSGGIGNLGIMTLNASTVFGNTAPRAGGLFNAPGATMTVRLSTITDNFATLGAGGLLNVNGTLIVTQSALLGNTSDGDGDALYSLADSVNATKVTNSCIAGNGDIGVFNERSTSQDFTGNWWGDPSGPSGAGPGTGDSIGDSIDFSGWLTTPPAICAP